MTTKSPLSEDRFTQVAFAVVTVLMTSGVIGVWSMSGSLARLEERVQIWTRVYGEKMDSVTVRVDQMSRDQRDTDRRLSAIEGQQQPPRR